MLLSPVILQFKFLVVWPIKSLFFWCKLIFSYKSFKLSREFLCVFTLIKLSILGYPMRGKMPHFLEWLLSISSRVFFLYFRSNVLSNSTPVFQLTLLLLKKLTLKMNLKKMFENSSGLHMKRCRFLKRRAVKIFNRVLQKRLHFCYWKLL